jgi:hypothetical protein
VLLTGSVPLRSAGKVFETVARHLGGVAPRMPDGEQIGWSSAARRTFEHHPALEAYNQAPLNAGGKDPVDIFRLRQGYGARDLVLGPYGYVENATRSYAAFKQLRDTGVIPAKTRYQATLPGPGTSAFCIELDADTLLPLAREAQAREIEGITATIPAADLAIQLDVGMEAEHEEFSPPARRLGPAAPSHLPLEPGADGEDVYRDPDAKPDIDALQHNVDTIQELGFTRSQIDIAKHTDLSFINAAVARLKQPDSKKAPQGDL